MAVLSDLAYDPETGVFTWLVASPRASVGSRAGTVAGKGYRYLKVGGKEYRASRLAWLFSHGEWPPKGMEIDHINGDRDDDRIANLRLATGRENCRNRGRSKANTTGVKGASIKKGRFAVRISTPLKRVYLGSFATAEEAHAAYTAAAERYHGEFARVA